MDILFFFGSLALIGYGIYRVRRNVKRQISNLSDRFWN